MLWSFSFLISKVWVPTVHQEDVRRSSLKVFISEALSPHSGSLNQTSQKIKEDSTSLFLRLQRLPRSRIVGGELQLLYVLMATCSLPWRAVKSHTIFAWLTTVASHFMDTDPIGDVQKQCGSACWPLVIKGKTMEMKESIESSQMIGTGWGKGRGSSADPVWVILWLYLFIL